LLLPLLPQLGFAGSPERAAIAAERAAVQQRFVAEERDCQGRFAVNACVEDARQRRREALAQLRERELKLDQAERQRRAAERREAVAAKQAAARARPPTAAASAAPPQLRVREPLLPASGAARPSRSGPDRNEQAAAAAERARASEARRQDIQAAQERVKRREAERAARGKDNAPLPLPAASAPKPGR
jgi:colicin import membrane protein